VVRRDIKFDEEKAMRVSLERELKGPQIDVEGPQIDVENPHVEVQRVETSTQADSSSEGIKCTREADRLLDDAWENV